MYNGDLLEFMVQSPISRVTVRPDPVFGQRAQYRSEPRPGCLCGSQYRKDPRPADMWIIGDLRNF